ncbi:MAG TPA: hypothetical protein DIW30_00750 [Bacteroidales bacterium]|nr:hypothetical protein [Bacteroidales bacterium]
MRKHLLAVVCMMFPLLLPAQGLRHSVAIVAPEYSQKDSILFCGYATELVRISMYDESRMLTAYAQGTFGSGVLIEHNGKRYVLTNRHVVGYANYATLTFELHERTIRLPHCPLVSTSEEYDLALIALSSQDSALIPLPFSTAQAEEGLNITAAGFPGLAGKASWQMTRGTISNSALYIEKLGQTYIQHTAAIDPGSSGGPLLIKQNGKYEVAGINTLKDFGRDQVGVAIPISAAKKYIMSQDTAIHGQTGSKAHRLLQWLYAYDAEDWSKYYYNIPTEERMALREKDADSPLQLIKDVIEANGVQPDGTRDRTKAMSNLQDEKVGLNKNMSHSHIIVAEYNSLFKSGDMVSLSYQDVSGYFLRELRLSVPMLNCVDLTSRAIGFSVGYGIGGQVPIRLKRNNYLRPYGLFAIELGVLFPNKELAVPVGAAVRAGVDYIHEFKHCDLLIGANYSFMPTFCFLDELYVVGIKPHRFVYLLQGAGVHIGIGF